MPFPPEHPNSPPPQHEYEFKLNSPKLVKTTLKLVMLCFIFELHAKGHLVSYLKQEYQSF